jgi:hypothetical protein
MYHPVSFPLKLRRLAHRVVDPLRALPDQQQARRLLRTMKGGTYLPYPHLPYVPQFASPALIHAYIHEGYDGVHDPNWAGFGAPDPLIYRYWAHRACAIACLKMAADGMTPRTPQSLYTWIQQGVALGGYDTVNDEGWFYAPLRKLANQAGLTAQGAAYVSPERLALSVINGSVVMAAVTPELGETGRLRRYDGHFVLVYAVTLRAGQLHSVWLHNPSGRVKALQAEVEIPISRFRAGYAYRFIALSPFADALPSE